MPANFTRYPNSETKVFGAEPAWGPRGNDLLTLDADTLRAYGTIGVPGHVWRAMQRLGAWIEPVLVSEWARIMRSYGERDGRAVRLGQAEAALEWLDPVRDTAFAKHAVQRLLAAGTTVECVWTGSRLRAGSADIDHCLPWSAWPCGDLWNLLPANRRVNQHLKRDRLPSAPLLEAARPRVLAWWAMAWSADPVAGAKFRREAAAALPVGSGDDLEDVFSGVEWRRLKLRQDQQVEEWLGPCASGR